MHDHPTAGRTLADALRSSGAVMTVRDGQAVPAHYGSSATELAICVSHAGVAIRSELDVLELTAQRGWLEEALSSALGRVPLTPGWAVNTGSAWCALVDPGRALVVGAPAEMARWRRLAGSRATRAGHSITCADRSAATTAITVVGPLLEDLLARASLPVDVPVGGVRSCMLGGAPVTVLRKLPDRCLLLVPRHHAPAACWELLDAGEPSGAGLVGLEALERLAASERHAQAFA